MDTVTALNGIPYEDILQNAPVGIFFSNSEGRLRFVNQKYLDILNLPENLLLEKGWQINILKEDDELVIKSWNRFVVEKNTFNYEFRIQKNQDTVIWVRKHATTLKDKNGVVVGILGTLTDITDQVTFEKLLNKFKKAVEKTDSEILFTDVNGTILYANQAAERNSGYDSGQIIGQKSSRFWGNTMPESFHSNLWKTIKDGKTSYEGEVTNKRRDGTRYYAHLSISPVCSHTGEIEFFVSVQKDVTKFKELDKAREDFISLASHQLRTPLSSTKWLCEILINEGADLNKDRIEMLATLQELNERMIKLINSLLSISKIESGEVKTKPETVDMNSLVLEASDELTRDVQLKRIKLKKELSALMPNFFADKKLMREVLMNLIGNAVKYTPMGGTVALQTYNESDNVIFKVADNGIGIPKKQQSRVFERFFRAENAARTDPNGTGLGLYLAKLILDISGGSISFESSESSGTTFWVKFPVSHEPSLISALV